MLKNIIVEKIHSDAVIPHYQKDGDVGADLVTIDDYFIPPGSKMKIHTGLRFALPDHDRKNEGARWEIQIRPRSGISHKTNLRISNSPGTVDNYYMDELCVLVNNIHLPIDENVYNEDRSPFGINLVDWVLDLKGNVIYLNTIDYKYSRFKVPEGTYFIDKGQRFAQMVISEAFVPINGFIEGKIKDFYPDSRNRASGFGGTGV